MRRRRDRWDEYVPVMRNLRTAVYRVQNGKCLKCQRAVKLESDNAWEAMQLSHIVPLGRGMSRNNPGATRKDWRVRVFLNTRPNLEGLCLRCHSDVENTPDWQRLEKAIRRYARNMRGWPPSASFERFLRKVWDRHGLDPSVLEEGLQVADPRHRKFRCKALCKPPAPEDPTVEWPHSGLVRCKWVMGHRGPHRLVMTDGQAGGGVGFHLEVETFEVEEWLKRRFETCKRCAGGGHTFSGHDCEDCKGKGYLPIERNG